MPVVVALSAPPAWASGSASAVAQFKKVDSTFAIANIKWSNVLTASSISLSKLQKAGKAFAPALVTFDGALLKIAFKGKTESDILAVTAINRKAVPIVSHITSLSSFEKQYGALLQSYMNLQAAVGKDLGIPTADVVL